MEDTKLKEKCPHCGNHLILMESINNKHELWLVKRCLECGDYPCKEVVLLKDYNKTTEEVVDEKSYSEDAVIFADGECPVCSSFCSNGGHGGLKCECGWTQDEEEAAETQRIAKEIFDSL